MQASEGLDCPDGVGWGSGLRFADACANEIGAVVDRVAGEGRAVEGRGHPDCVRQGPLPQLVESWGGAGGIVDARLGEEGSVVEGLDHADRARRGATVLLLLSTDLGEKGAQLQNKG